MVGYPRAFLMLKPFYHKKNCLSSLLAPCCAPFFVKRKPPAFFFSSFAGKLTSRGSRRRRHDAPCRFLNALVRIPLIKYRKTKRTSKKCLSVLLGGGRGIRTPVGFHPNGFQDRLVMTASIFLHVVCQARIIRTMVWRRIFD